MTGLDLSRRVLDQLRDAADIVTVVGDYLTLRKAGRNFVGLCPFHGEKTGSFNVSREKGTYYCFGCKKGGDVIDFVMEMERIAFPDAVERLAHRFGVALPESSPAAAQRRSDNDQLRDALEAAQALFANRVTSDRPRAFLERRGIPLELAREFGLGYAPPEWRLLHDELRRRHPERVLVAAGLVVEGEQGKKWDRFRDRVTIPIRDGRGRLIAFGGRALGDDPAKYLNSPETPLFSKSQTLFALDRAARSFATTDRAIVVEGYFDCIALHSAGFTETVATLGTALTEHHARELKRKVPLVVLCFDGDTAGRNAARQALRTLLAAELHASILLLAEGLDPDDIVRRDGRDGIAALMSRALSETEFLIAGMGSSRDERRANLRSALEVVDACPDPVRRFAMREDLARAAGVPVDQVGAHEHPRFVVDTHRDLTDLALLRCLLHEVPVERRRNWLERVRPSLLADPQTRRIVEAMHALVAAGDVPEASAVLGLVESTADRALIASLEYSEVKPTEEALPALIRQLERRELDSHLAELTRQIEVAERIGDAAGLARLVAAQIALSKRARSL